ncbi:MAG: hypothetical protein WAM73_16555 [Desulfobacterales bacterium]
MTQHSSTTDQTEERPTAKVKDASSTRKAGREINEKYQDVKRKAAETKDRFAEKASDTASTVKKESRAMAKEVVHKGRDVGSSVYEALSENLFPAILTGIGVAWLTAGIVRGRSDSRPKPGIYRDSVSSTKETLSEWSDKAKNFTQDTVSDIGDKAREVTHRAKAGSRRTREKSKEVITSNSLYVAGALFAMGALIGLALPETGRERQLYGEMREDLQEGRKNVETDAG